MADGDKVILAADQILADMHTVLQSILIELEAQTVLLTTIAEA
jgi:hypothetical protein